MISANFINDLLHHYDALKYDFLELQTFSEKDFGFPPTYYKVMETDQSRITAFTKAFEKYNFTDKIVCEAGIGTLVLSKHFLNKVKKAYLIESNTRLRPFIEKEIAKNNWADKVEVIYGDAIEVSLPESVDFVVGEMMSVFCANEYQVQVFKNLRQYLKPNGKLLPESIINVIQLAQADFKKDYKHLPVIFSRHLPQQLSLQQVVNIIDLYEVEEETVTKRIEVMPVLTGSVNCVFLQSFVEIAEGYNFTGTDSLMPPTICQLETPSHVRKGVSVWLNIKYQYGTSLDEAQFWIEEKNLGL